MPTCGVQSGKLIPGDQSEDVEMRNLVTAVRLACLAAATMIIVSGSDVQAAPQALGLIATNGEVELNRVGD